MPDPQRVLLVGESNPYGGSDDNALVPWPEGCSGWRLCHTIMGLDEGTYLDRFDRANLARGPWRIRVAREAVKRLVHPRRILLGEKVAAAHGLDFVPFNRMLTLGGGFLLMWPHPSGRNFRAWTTPAVEQARHDLAAIMK